MPPDPHTDDTLRDVCEHAQGLFEEMRVALSSATEMIFLSEVIKCLCLILCVCDIIHVAL